MTLRLAMIGLLAVLVPASVFAQGAVYRWKDENGKVHFSNVPSDGAAREGAEMVAPESAPAAPAGGVSSSEPRAAAPEPAGTPGPYSSLSDDGFSSRATAERLKLKRELAAAKRELEDASRDYDSEVARKNVPTPAQVHDRIFVGVTGVENGAPPDREEELRVRKERAAKRVEEIRGRYGVLEAEAIRRHGSLPGWWLSIE